MQAGAGRRGGDEAVSQEGKTPMPRGPHKRRSRGAGGSSSGTKTRAEHGEQGDGNKEMERGWRRGGGQ